MGIPGEARGHGCLPRGGVGGDLQEEIHTGRDGGEIHLVALGIHQRVGELGDGDGGLRGGQPDRAHQLATRARRGGGHDLHARARGLCQTGVRRSQQVVIHLLDALRPFGGGVVASTLPVVEPVEGKVVRQVPDGCLGGGDRLPVGQAGGTRGRGDLGEIHLRVATLDDPVHLLPDLMALAELVFTGEGRPASLRHLAAPLGVDVELDAVGQDLAAVGVGVDRQQLRPQRAVPVQVVSVDEFGVLPELRIARLVLIGAGGWRANRQNAGDQRSDDG